MRMPNAAKCHVAESKIRDYLLNLGHVDGKSKASFFASFGFRIDAWTALHDALRQHPVSNELKQTVTTEFGTKYVVACSLATPSGRSPCIVTVWMDDGNGVPRLVTAYPGPV